MGQWERLQLRVLAEAHVITDGRFCESNSFLRFLPERHLLTALKTRLRRMCQEFQEN